MKRSLIRKDLKILGLIGVLLVVLLTALSLPAWSDTWSTGTYLATVESRNDLFDAGDTTPGSRGGVLPTVIVLPAYPIYVEFESVSGKMNADSGGWPWNGPDGGKPCAYSLGTNIYTADGISGILGNTYLFLAGVFLDKRGSLEGEEPARLDFTSTGIGTDFTDLRPLPAQMFFIGDGHNNGGLKQRFYVPSGATHLYLGVADAVGFGWYPGHDSGEKPSSYGDNLGSYSVTLNIIKDLAPRITSYTADPTSGIHPLDVAFQCTATDPDGSVVEYRWRFGDGSTDTTTTGQTTHTYTEPGTFSAKVTVVDNEGATRSSTPIGIKVSYGPELTGKCERYVFDDVTRSATVKVRIVNNGDTPSSPFKVAFHLSDDGTTPLSPPFRTMNVTTGLAASETTLLTPSKIFGSSIYGKYILIYIDSGKEVEETDETNNGIRIVVQPMTTE
jgi:PKD repeat protein